MRTTVLEAKNALQHWDVNLKAVCLLFPSKVSQIHVVSAQDRPQGW
jgi:hypothetical protein